MQWTAPNPAGPSSVLAVGTFPTYSTETLEHVRNGELLDKRSGLFVQQYYKARQACGQIEYPPDVLHATGSTQSRRRKIRNHLVEHNDKCNDAIAALGAEDTIVDGTLTESVKRAVCAYAGTTTQFVVAPGAPGSKEPPQKVPRDTDLIDSCKGMFDTADDAYAAHSEQPLRNLLYTPTDMENANLLDAIRTAPLDHSTLTSSMNIQRQRMDMTSAHSMFMDSKIGAVVDQCGADMPICADGGMSRPEESNGDRNACESRQDCGPDSDQQCVYFGPRCTDTLGHPGGTLEMKPEEWNTTEACAALSVCGETKDQPCDLKDSCANFLRTYTFENQGGELPNAGRPGSAKQFRKQCTDVYGAPRKIPYESGKSQEEACKSASCPVCAPSVAAVPDTNDTDNFLAAMQECQTRTASGEGCGDDNMCVQSDQCMVSGEDPPANIKLLLMHHASALAASSCWRQTEAAKAHCSASDLVPGLGTTYTSKETCETTNSGHPRLECGADARQRCVWHEDVSVAALSAYTQWAPVEHAAECRPRSSHLDPLGMCKDIGTSGDATADREECEADERCVFRDRGADLHTCLVQAFQDPSVDLASSFGRSVYGSQMTNLVTSGCTDIIQRTLRIPDSNANVIEYAMTGQAPKRTDPHFRRMLQCLAYGPELERANKMQWNDGDNPDPADPTDWDASNAEQGCILSEKAKTTFCTDEGDELSYIECDGRRAPVCHQKRLGQAMAYLWTEDSCIKKEGVPTAWTPYKKGKPETCPKALFTHTPAQCKLKQFSSIPGENTMENVKAQLVTVGKDGNSTCRSLFPAPPMPWDNFLNFSSIDSSYGNILMIVFGAMEAVTLYHVGKGAAQAVAESEEARLANPVYRGLKFVVRKPAVAKVLYGSAAALGHLTPFRMARSVLGSPARFVINKFDPLAATRAESMAKKGISDLVMVAQQEGKEAAAALAEAIDGTGIEFLRKAAQQKAASAAKKGTLLEEDKVFLETGEMEAPELQKFLLKQAHSDAVVGKVTTSMGAMFERIGPEKLGEMLLGETAVGVLMESGVFSELGLTLQAGMDAQMTAEVGMSAPEILDAMLESGGELSEKIVDKTAQLTYDFAMRASNSMALGAEAAVADVEGAVGAKFEELKASKFLNEAFALDDETMATFGEIAGTTEEAEEAIGSLNKKRIGEALGKAMTSLGNQVLMETMTFWSPTSEYTLGLDPPTDGFKALEYSLS
jgi:hypothetical protein